MMRYAWIWTLVGMVLVVGLVLASTAMLTLAADSDIVISEVSYNASCLGTDPATCGTTGNENRFEWVEIYNKSNTATVDVNGWEICDNRTSETCVQISSLPLEIGPGQCWVIGYNATATQTELSDTGHGASFDAGRYIALNSPIGNGLTNEVPSGETEEAVKLKNGSGTVIDCVSWKSGGGSVCGGTDDTSLHNAANGTSIANIQGTWYRHGPGSSGTTNQASPFNCANTAAGGSPTAISLFSFYARSGQRVAYPERVLNTPSIWQIVVLVAVCLAVAGAGLIALRFRPTQ